jgi:hypothetical protein
MGDVRVALDLEEARDVDASGNADAREVVAPEIDEHHVLGAVLLRREQPLRVAGAALGRSGDRVEARAVPLALDERLGRGADQCEPVELEQEQVRRRVDPAQGPVEVERRGRGGARRSLREDDLERVAAADVLLRRPHRGLVVVAAGRPLREAPAAVRAREPRRGAGEQPRDLVGVAADHLRSVEDMVEADEDVGDEEAALREAGALRRQLDGGLEPSRVVVGEVADDRLPAGLGLCEVTEVRAAADERVPAEPAALDGLEQEGGAASRRSRRYAPSGVTRSVAMSVRWS